MKKLYTFVFMHEDRVDGEIVHLSVKMQSLGETAQDAFNRLVANNTCYARGRSVIDAILEQSVEAYPLVRDVKTGEDVDCDEQFVFEEVE